MLVSGESLVVVSCELSCFRSVYIVVLLFAFKQKPNIRFTLFFCVFIYVLYYANIILLLGCEKDKQHLHYLYLYVCLYTVCYAISTLLIFILDRYYLFNKMVSLSLYGAVS